MPEKVDSRICKQNVNVRLLLQNEHNSFWNLLYVFLDVFGTFAFVTSCEFHIRNINVTCNGNLRFYPFVSDCNISQSHSTRIALPGTLSLFYSKLRTVLIGIVSLSNFNIRILLFGTISLHSKTFFNSRTLCPHQRVLTVRVSRVFWGRQPL